MSKNWSDIHHDTVNLKMDILLYIPENVLNMYLKLKDLQKMELNAMGFENLAKHWVKKVEFRLLDRNKPPLDCLNQFYGDLIVID